VRGSHTQSERALHRMGVASRLPLRALASTPGSSVSGQVSRAGLAGVGWPKVPGSQLTAQCPCLRLRTICHAPNTKQRIIIGISANISSLIGAETVFSQRSIRISYTNIRNKSTAGIAKYNRRMGEKAAARQKRGPPKRDSHMIHCSTFMRTR
jgi:hypothetical protein